MSKGSNEKICKQCGKIFNTYKKTQMFCSRECRGISQTQNIKVICDYCGKDTIKQPYQVKKNKYNYCNKECQMKGMARNNIGKTNKGEKIKFTCEYCGSESSQPKSQYDRNKTHYCSKECAYKGISEIYIKEERYNYNSEKVSCEKCGKEFYRANYKSKRHNHTYCSQECSQKGNSKIYRGDKRYNFNPNITDEERIISRDYPEYKDFVRSVMERDCYICQISGQVGGELRVHHLDGYSWYIEGRTDINNGITISKELHDLFHKAYGFKDNTKEQFEEFKLNMTIPR